MKIAVLADQHGALPPIPDCDLMILSGDICGGPAHEDGRWRPDLSDDHWHAWLKADFTAWLRGAPLTIAVSGNHDTAIARFGMPDVAGMVFLRDSGVEHGGLRFWGSPWVRKWDDLAFNLPDAELQAKWDQIPAGTDVLVCHQLPRMNGGLIELGLGCPLLARAIERVRPKLVTCGHIHECRGVYDLRGVKVVNSALGFTEVDL